MKREEVLNFESIGDHNDDNAYGTFDEKAIEESLDWIKEQEKEDYEKWLKQQKEECGEDFGEDLILNDLEIGDND